MPKKAKAKSVFHDLYDPDKAAVMEIRSTLMIGLSQWLTRSKLTQSEAAKVLVLLKHACRISSAAASVDSALIC